MNVLIKKGKACGRVQAPPSKSMAHRLLICSFLAGGGNISGYADSEDIKATRSCISALQKGEDTLFCNESGSTLRFMIPICLMQGRKITLCGTERLLSRGLSVYEDICKKSSTLFEHRPTSVTVCGPLVGGSYKVRGDISSQFISGLLFDADTDGEKTPEDATEDATEDNSKKTTVEAKLVLEFDNDWIFAVTAILCSIAYLAIGFLLPRGWECGWIVYMLVPVIPSLVSAIVTRRASEFLFPVFVTGLYLTAGMCFGRWHPDWIIFLTVPIYYIVAEAFEGKAKKKD